MAANKANEMTREGYDKLNAELDHLVMVVRKENAEYDAAKDAQAETEERISTIEEILRTAKIVDETVDDGDDTVQTGRTVKLRDMNLKETFTYKIVGTTEADPLNGKLSNASLVGQHIMGKKAGEVVEFPVPDGIAKYKIMEVKR